MSIKDLIIEHYGDHSDEGPLLAAGFDDALIGIDPNSLRAVYSRNKCIDMLVEEGESVEDAMDFLEYNTFNTYVGEYTPIFIEDFQWDT